MPSRLLGANQQTFICVILSMKHVVTPTEGWRNCFSGVPAGVSRLLILNKNSCRVQVSILSCSPHQVCFLQSRLFLVLTRQISLLVNRNILIRRKSPDLLPSHEVRQTKLTSSKLKKTAARKWNNFCVIVADIPFLSHPLICVDFECFISFN